MAFRHASGPKARYWDEVAQVIRPRLEGGCDWVSERYVIVRLLDGRELWWRFSCKTWEGRLQGHQSQPARLVLVKWPSKNGMPDYRIPDCQELAEGGRLSHSLILAHHEVIDAEFGPGAAEAASGATMRRKTLVEVAVNEK